jgi:hypothetical protein
MSTNDEIAKTLFDAGRADLAELVRQGELARLQGRDDRADAPERPAEARQLTPDEQQGQADDELLSEIRRRQEGQWVSIPGLIDG